MPFLEHDPSHVAPYWPPAFAGAALAVLPEAASRANAAELPADGGAGKSTYVYVSTNGISTPGVTSPIGISVYRLDPKVGTLTPVQSVTDAYPSWIEVDPSERFLHACYALTSGTQLVARSRPTRSIRPAASWLCRPFRPHPPAMPAIRAGRRSPCTRRASSFTDPTGARRPSPDTGSTARPGVCRSSATPPRA
jgi:hypothetical protein